MCVKSLPEVLEKHHVINRISAEENIEAENVQEVVSSEVTRAQSPREDCGSTFQECRPQFIFWMDGSFSGSFEHRQGGQE